MILVISSNLYMLDGRVNAYVERFRICCMVVATIPLASELAVAAL